jgi:hypothetical protein
MEEDYKPPTTTDPRVVKITLLGGFIGLPMGLALFDKRASELKILEVSTVNLEGGHLESPLLNMLEPEHGYETSVFIESCRFFSIFDQKYDTLEEAKEGHDKIVAKLNEGTLPLMIYIKQYSVRTKE